MPRDRHRQPARRQISAISVRRKTKVRGSATLRRTVRQAFFVVLPLKNGRPRIQRPSLIGPYPARCRCKSFRGRYSTRCQVLVYRPRTRTFWVKSPTVFQIGQSLERLAVLIAYQPRRKFAGGQPEKDNRSTTQRQSEKFVAWSKGSPWNSLSGACILRLSGDANRRGRGSVVSAGNPV
jgi:hypothetical protein